MFGASSRGNIEGARELVAEHWGELQMSTLLVASTGGHLKQLHRLPGASPGRGSVSVGHLRHAQSRSLLEGETVDFVHFVGRRP